MNRLLIISVFAICVLFLGLGLTLYFINFQGDLSKNQSDWGAFGEYFGLFVNITNMILIVLITIITFNSAKRIALSQLRIEELKVTPHLYITERRSNLLSPQDSWYIQHTGEGPAINILVRFNLGRNTQFTRWISCLTLGAGDERELVWLRFADTIQITYCDITEQNCMLYSLQDRIGRTTKIPREEYSDFLNIAIANNLNTYPDLVNRYLQGGHANYQPFFNNLL